MGNAPRAKKAKLYNMKLNFSKFNFVQFCGWLSYEMKLGVRGGKQRLFLETAELIKLIFGKVVLPPQWVIYLCELIQIRKFCFSIFTEGLPKLENSDICVSQMVRQFATLEGVSMIRALFIHRLIDKSMMSHFDLKS